MANSLPMNRMDTRRAIHPCPRILLVTYMDFKREQSNTTDRDCPIKFVVTIGRTSAIRPESSRSYVFPMKLRHESENTVYFIHLCLRPSTTYPYGCPISEIPPITTVYRCQQNWVGAPQMQIEFALVVRYKTITPGTNNKNTVYSIKQLSNETENSTASETTDSFSNYPDDYVRLFSDSASLNLLQGTYGCILSLEIS